RRCILCRSPRVLACRCGSGDRALQECNLSTEPSVDCASIPPGPSDCLGRDDRIHFRDAPPQATVQSEKLILYSVGRQAAFISKSPTNPATEPPFLPLATGIVGQPGTTTFTDTNAVGAGPFFYRVGVRE